jgi:hypothetical protein
MARKRKAGILGIHHPEIQITIIRDMLAKYNQNISEAARQLDLDSSNLRRLMRKIHYPGYPFNPGHNSPAMRGAECQEQKIPPESVTDAK